MIFTEFTDFVDERFGLAEVDTMISASGSSGVYTSVGTYPHHELVAMLVALSQSTKVSIAELLQQFGEHLFGFLVRSYPDVLRDASDAFALLRSIDSHIHVEVRKLYPDSELPEFRYEMLTPDEMLLNYRSERGLADLAEGLLRGCFVHYGEQVQMRREDESDGQGKHVQFRIRRVI